MSATGLLAIVPCPECWGNGAIDGITCTDCEGTGAVRGRIVGPDVLAVVARIVAREREDRKCIGPFLSDDDLARMIALLGGAS